MPMIVELPHQVRHCFNLKLRCINRYVHNNQDLKPPLILEQGILQHSYAWLKFKKLDIVYASDIVGDVESDIVGPFQAALRVDP
jgi:hypothetical protein